MFIFFFNVVDQLKTKTKIFLKKSKINFCPSSNLAPKHKNKVLGTKDSSMKNLKYVCQILIRFRNSTSLEGDWKIQINVSKIKLLLIALTLKKKKKPEHGLEKVLSYKKPIYGKSANLQ